VVRNGQINRYNGSDIGIYRSIKDDYIQLPLLIKPMWPEPSSLTRSDEEIVTGVLTVIYKEELSEKRSLYKLQLNKYN
jgi:hypothetical protein